MKHRQHRLSLLIQASFASSAVACAGAAMAQDAAAPEAPASAASGAAADLSRVTVTGFRASLQRALDVKRHANAIVDAISAEDIGKFPDTNAAESLSHLPGISVDRQFGEGEKVSINGTDPALNRVLVNGQTIASGNWGGYPLDNSDRTFNYTLLSPEIIGLMEVYKSPEARIDEGSIGGTVIVHTRNPLDLPKNTVRGSLGYNYNDRSKQGSPRLSLLGSWKSDDASFGAIASYTHDKENLSRAGIETFYYTGADGIGTTTPVTVTGGTTADLNAKTKLPYGLSSSYFQQVRQRDGLQGALQWKPNDNNELSLTGVYIVGKYNNYSEARYVCPGCSKSQITAVGVENGFVTSGTVTGTADNPAYAELDANYRETEVKTDSLNLKHDFTMDGWKLTSQIGTTRASGGKNPEYLQKFLLKSGGYKFNYSSSETSVVYDDASASNWWLPGAKGLSAGGTTIPGDSTLDSKYQAGGLEYTTTSDKEHYFQFDVKKDVEWGPVNQVLVGVKYIKHDNSQYSYGNRINTTDDIYLTQFDVGSTPSNLFDGLGASDDLVHWSTANLNSVIDYLKSQPQGTMFLKTGQIFDVAETTRDAFTQVNYDIGPVRGNLGVRLLHTSDDSTYYFSSDGSSAVLTTTSHSYTKALPSFNLAYDFAPDKVARLSIAKVMARPRYSDLAGQTTLDSTTHTGSGGNPDLKPYEATNVDLATEWYYMPNSLLGAEFFYRDIGNYVVTNVADVSYPNLSTVPFIVSTPVNARGAQVRGLSLLYQQALPLGFGLQSNWTYTNAHTAPDLQLPFQSKNTVSVIPYYEAGPWSARFAYTYRSAYFTQVSQLKGTWFADSYKQLDFSASYQATKNVSVMVGANNLLDSKYYWYYGGKYAPIGEYKNGRNYTLRLNFAL